MDIQEDTVHHEQYLGIFRRDGVKGEGFLLKVRGFGWAWMLERDRRYKRESQRLVEEGPVDRHTGAVGLALTDGVPCAHRQVERLGVPAAGAVVCDGSLDGDAVVQVRDGNGLSAKRRVIASRLCRKLRPSCEKRIAQGRDARRATINALSGLMLPQAPYPPSW